MKPSKKQESYCYYYLGRSYLNDGATTKTALKYFNKSIRIDSTYYKAFYYRAYIYKLMDKRAEAIDDYTKCIELKPGWAEGYACRGKERIYKIIWDNNNTYVSIYGKDACADLQRAKELGATDVQEALDLYCK